MLIRVLNSFTEAEPISEQWNELLNNCSASHVPFLRFEYLKTWWQTLGGGEWSQGQLMLAIASRDDGTLAGVAPLFFTHNLQGEPVLMLVGSIEISDYLDFIVPSPELPEFTSALLRYLAEQNNRNWRILDLYNIPDNSPTLEALKVSAAALGWAFRLEQLQPCPAIPLPGDWEAYLLQIDKKQRHEIRRKMRRAEDYQPPTRWYLVEEKNVLDNEIDEFLDLMSQDPEKARFLTGKMRDQMRQIVHTAFNAGWLQLAFLEVGGEKAAGYLNFDFAGHIWVYNSGINYRFRDLSAGWVLLGHLLKWANEQGRKSFDFMRGSEDYKYRFGGIDRYVVRARLERS